MFLVLSILVSVLIWSFLYGLKFAIVLITAVFIHEYGHFYWMGREGIKDKDMFFLPPFGAVARSKEPWPSYGAQMRIALAGPAFGLLSVLLFYVLWLVTGNYMFLASLAMACLINLFNLILPVAILDGGRVINSILYSINRKLGDGFYVFGFFVLGTAYLSGYLRLPMALVVGFLLSLEWGWIKDSRAKLKALEAELPGLIEQSGSSPENIKKMEELSMLDKVVNMKKMSKAMVALGSVVYVGIITAYVYILYWASGYVRASNFQEYFK